MNANKARRIRQNRAQVFKLQAEGISRQHGFRLHQALELLEQSLLDFEVLVNRFDHDIRLRGTVALRVRNQPIHHIVQQQLVANSLAIGRVNTGKRRRDTLHSRPCKVTRTPHKAHQAAISPPITPAPTT